MSGIRRRALIDVDAFRRQVGEIWDARADAFGHGIGILAPAALDAGVQTVVVSDERDAGVARAAGFASDAIVVDRDARGDASRPYGLDGAGVPLVSLVGEVVAVKTVGTDEGVSYGYTYRTPGPTRLALVALGYADGVPRLASNRARVSVNGGTHPLVGRIAMDQLVLDVGEADVSPGDDAVLFGDPARGEPSARDWAAWTGRDPLDLTAGIASRVIREAR